MSYDLFFYKHNSNKIIEQDFADYLTENLPFNASDIPKQWDYYNKETGVNFLIDWNKPNNEKESIELFDSFENFTNLNFSCSINFFRPRFFGFEIFPMIDKWAVDLDLYILNYQDEINPDTPQKIMSGYLEAQWIRHNDKVTLANFKELKINYFSLEKSNYFWKYLSQKNKLQEKLGDNIFVCGCFFFKSNEDGKIYTATTWTEHIPIVIPPVDFVIVQKKYKKFFKTIEVSGFIPYSSIMAEFEGFFKRFDHVFPDLMCLNQEDSDKAAKKFNKLKIWKSLKEFGIEISSSVFVNVKPD